MYACLECQRTFAYPTRWTERHGLDYGPFEELSGCPSCGGGYVKTYECDGCGKYILGDYIKTISGYRYCENCHIQIDIEYGEE